MLRYYKRNPLEQAGLRVVSDVYARESAMHSILFGGNSATLFSPGELLNLWNQARIMSEHGGAFAEVGAFKGDSAEVACRAKGDRQFYIFEAFDGLAPVDAIDPRFKQGAFASQKRDLCRRLESYPNTTIIAGYFPDTAGPVLQEKFSYVHLDVDLYQATREALTFFYPRMLRGGRIISHDYGHCSGVWQAVDEFFANKPEVLEPVGVSQVIVIKQ